MSAETSKEQLQAKPLEHVESSECWCGPTLDYVDPETGVEVWVHHKGN